MNVSEKTIFAPFRTAVPCSRTSRAGVHYFVF
jgi:hypothetical protein